MANDDKKKPEEHKDEIKELTQEELETVQGGILRNWGLLHPVKCPDHDKQYE